MIYLDNAATTFPKPLQVYDAMDKMNREGAVNAGRGSYKTAREASKLIADTKKQMRDLVHVDMSAAVVLTPSITIAINQIVHGLVLRDGAVIYVSPYEHNAVARSVHHLAKKRNIKIRELPINWESLEIDLEKVKYVFAKEKPSVVFCTHVSNVTGYILPIKEIFAEAKKHDSITVLDSAQSLGLLNIDANSLGVDIIAFTGHKSLYGPIGIAGFINVSGVSLDVCITGGTGSDSLNLNMPDGNESKFEAASMNIVAVAGLNAALSCLDQKANLEREHELTEYLVEKLHSLKNVNLFIPHDRKKHIGIVSFVIKGMNSEDVGMILDEDFDIAVRTGYHCAPYIHSYLKDEANLGTIRIGLGMYSCENELDALVDALKEICNE